MGTRSGQRATDAARTTPLAGEGSLAGEDGCDDDDDDDDVRADVLFGEAGGEAVAAVARPSFERRASLSQSSGETAGCCSAVATSAWRASRATRARQTRCSSSFSPPRVMTRTGTLLWCSHAARATWSGVGSGSGVRGNGLGLGLGLGLELGLGVGLG